MICSQDSARVLVTELSGSGQMNPTPAAYEDSDMQVELYLSPEKLKALSGTEDLVQVTSLEMCVDTQESTLGNFGAYLPKLVQLKMNNSMIMSVRDLGTTLSHLQVLWMSRCNLADLDGIPSFSSLKELYVAYNSVSDLSQVSMLENLQLLDLEGNDVNDLVQVQYLGLCSQLRTLTLEGNPVCMFPHPNATQEEEEGYCYRSLVRELVPQLRYLDDMHAREEAGSRSSSSMGEDWALLRESFKDCSSTETAEEKRAASVCVYSRPSSGQHLASSLSSSRPSSRPVTARPLSAAGSTPLSGSRPLSAAGYRALSPPGSRSGSADADPVSVDPDASILTHGAGKVLFCGSPVQALRARRQKMRNAAPSPVSTPSTPPLHVPEHTYDLEEQEGCQGSDVFSELRAWREQHNKRLLAMERDGPQILTILNGDEEEDDESLNIFSGKEEEEEGKKESAGLSHWLNTDSTDSSSQSPSPDVFPREAKSPEVARLSLSPDCTLSPSPPQSATSAPGSRRLSVLRAHRLRLSGGVAGAVVRPAEDHTDSETVTGVRILESQGLQEAVRPKVPLLLKTTYHMPHRPASSPLVRGLRSPTGGASVQSVNGLQPIVLCRPPGRPAIMRPHAAKAALQKTPQRLTLQPSRGNSHLD
ncbi:leucine-rich repeat-containing protein 56 isoform X2 [Oncorhynchus mykiss]|uniref:leucine-rich repeat-containing protein 56 isoform X2 n=1 Tax=Oncorhynchus mykiss TaxID=8022 RepID=UPI001877C4B7|nr:leucine-rich repeat-containing protein 56 isoform X2 [Oncorhynchus mykiss]